MYPLTFLLHYVYSHTKKKKNKTTIFLPPRRKWWNALFISKEIMRINHSLHMNQPFEIVLEIFVAPNASLFNACVSLVICSDVKIPVIDICSSRIF
ncbi:hypothetical protein CUMW_008450 [Citrus unshiu]|nr:hypothetical protein CUMW_008450 [Citrus unshiu]